MLCSRSGAIGGLAASVLCVWTAAAQDTSAQYRQGRGMYVGGAAGANFQTDVDFRGAGTDSKATYDAGPVALLSLGYALGNGLRFEFEPGYRYNDVGKIN